MSFLDEILASKGKCTYLKDSVANLLKPQVSFSGFTGLGRSLSTGF